MSASDLSNSVASRHPDRQSDLVNPAERRELVSKLTSEILAEVAPEEIGVFAANEQWYVDGVGTPPASLRDEQSGFGVELLPALLPFVIQAVQTAVGWIVEAASDQARRDIQSTVQSWIRRHLHHDDAASATSTVLPPAALREIHDQIVSVLLTMRADPTDAGVVSDAVVGRLAIERRE
ncbi:MAG TPA: hypothetical protein VIW24_29785 [Aldersonia sp.]